MSHVVAELRNASRVQPTVEFFESWAARLRAMHLCGDDVLRASEAFGISHWNHRPHPLHRIAFFSLHFVMSVVV